MANGISNYNPLQVDTNAANGNVSQIPVSDVPGSSRVANVEPTQATPTLEVALLAGFDERSVTNVTQLVEPVPASASSATTLDHLGGEVLSNGSCKGTA
ncbi:hypothetical protein PHISCL_03770 [Aspergillus sclerotialis]|uniref:Uncharacterized protein n=1 Tax=Aspergillus sclerotialis TaxID=2070753 RepID=A0A3A2ZLI1_9EURO|nr:hypothetical protein PHISCL_03770 [Aspergillus sclerotialis]